MQAPRVLRHARPLYFAAARVPVARGLLIAIVLAGAFVTQRTSAAAPVTVDLSTYVRVGRFDLPEPTRTTPPANSLLAQEASGVTYDWDTDTLFVVGDGGTSVVQVSRTGTLINSMTLALGGSPQGTDFYDTEGIAYVGSGKFVLVEERDRQANLFTYVADGTLHRADVQTVKLGTTIGNIGLEGISWDPLTSGFIFVKEKDPQSIFQTTIDFVAGTASNGSPTATSSAALFSPALASLADFSDVFALSNLPSLNGLPDYSHLLVISQESGQIVNIDRSGNVSSRLTIVADPGSPLSVPDMTMEGVTMDRDGFLYVVNENGGGNANRPQLWVYAHSDAPNLAPTAVVLSNAVTSIPENTSTAAPVKTAEIVVIDDGLGTNNLSVSGSDAGSFQIIGTGLFLKAGTPLSSTNKSSYSVTVNVNDPAVGNTPDASTDFTLTVTASTGGTPALIISEVAPWASGSSPLGADWFEVTNVGTAAQDITGWRIDDNSNSFGSSLALNGITVIAPGESVIFIELGSGHTAAGDAANFKTLWFGANAPFNLKIGSYGGAGVGLSTGGDAVNLYNNAGVLQANIVFGVSPAGPFPSFDNASGLNNTTISTLSAVGINGAFAAANHSTEIGSPGTIGAPATPVVTIGATDADAAETGSEPGIFRITRTGSTVGALTVNYTTATGSGQATSADYTPALTGAATIASGQSFADITINPIDDNLFERPETVTLTLFDSGSYDVGASSTATVTIADNDFPDTKIDSAPATPTASRDAHFAFSVSNADSGVATFECSLDSPSFVACGSAVSYNGLLDGSHTFSVRAVDQDRPGNVDPTPASFAWTIDTTAPVITGSRAPLPNGAGWNNTDVKVTFSCSDPGGTGVKSCGPSPQVVSSEGAGQSRSASAADNVGNTASATVGGISIDKTPPLVACAATPDILWPPNGGLVRVSVAVKVSDALSGPDGFTLVSATSSDPDGWRDIKGFTVGTASTTGFLRATRSGSRKGRIYTLTYAGSDRAGNTATCIATVLVPHDQDKRKHSDRDHDDEDVEHEGGRHDRD